jgi:hypothetical protein
LFKGIEKHDMRPGIPSKYYECGAAFEAVTDWSIVRRCAKHCDTIRVYNTEREERNGTVTLLPHVS